MALMLLAAVLSLYGAALHTAAALGWWIAFPGGALATIGLAYLVGTDADRDTIERALWRLLRL